MQYLLVMAIMAMSLTIIFSSKLQRWHQVDVCISYISQRLQLPQSTRGTLLKLMLVSINLILLASAILHGSFDYINQSIYALVSSQHHLLIQLSLIHNAFCYIPFILLLTVAMALLLINQNQHRAAMHLCLSVSLAFVLCFALKYTIHYPRPSLVANFLGNQSLPSGHTCLTTAFVLSCFALPEHCKRMRLQLGIPFIVLTMATRVLIGAHWFSDVFMGWLLGYMAYLLTQLFINHYHANTISAMLQSYSVVVKHDVLMKSSQQRMLIAYAILSLAYAASTGKLIISPYLL
jgi:undecaprenyl-diphosphatase